MTCISAPFFLITQEKIKPNIVSKGKTGLFPVPGWKSLQLTFIATTSFIPSILPGTYLSAG